MNKREIVTAIFKSTSDATSAVKALVEGGIPRSDISVVSSERTNAESLGIQTQTMVGEGAALGGGIGGTVGAILVGLTAVGTLSSGGIGMLLAGPIVSVLAGAGAGAAAGGLVGALIGLGIPEHRIRFVEQAMESGAVLVGVHAGSARVGWIEKILVQYRGESVCEEHESSDFRLSSAPAPAAVAGVTVSPEPPPLPARSLQSGNDGNARGLREVFVDQLKDIYYAEKQLTEALPAMKSAASSPILARAVSDHLTQTRNHVTRLERVFESIGMMPQTKVCPAIRGLISEAEELMKLDDSPAERDAALICGAQKVEHYEMATYGCLVTYARQLGLATAADLLSDTLAEETQADQTLSKIAQGGINQQAAAMATA